MDVFQWDENLETGLAEVDRQHRQLVKVTNDFGVLISQNGVNPAEMERVFSELVFYTQYHFDEEEKLMDRFVVDPRHVAQHKREHQGFLEDVSQLHEQALSGSEAATSDLFDFLSNWLIYHILGSDMSLARQIRAITNGQNGEEAYHLEERKVDQATTLLLKSVNKLFSQVSNRNKQLSELNLTLEAKVRERTESLSEANRRLGELALTDVLTALPNRRHALQLLEELWQEAAEKNLPLACMMLDADGFKAINDTYGHDAGDLVLRELAINLKDAVRTDDIVCRLGGDEFLILCPGTDETGVRHIAELTHEKIAALRVPVNGGAWQGSISVGIAAREDSMQGPVDLMKAADRGVYAAKAAGKNCVKMAGAIPLDQD